MQVELVETWTGDELLLHGALQAADAGSSGDIDAAVLLSGVGSNFYSSGMMARLARLCSENGVAALRVNTRGHDYVTAIRAASGSRTQGAAYEIVDDCRHDVAAWVEFLAKRGYERVALIGHSLGALKALYSHRHQPHDAVAKVIAISPPRLEHELFLAGGGATAFRASWDEASALVEAGNPEMLFRASFPFSFIMSAGTFVDKYGPGGRYDWATFADEIGLPLCFVFGELELRDGGVPFRDVDRMARQLTTGTTAEVVTVPGANHFYANAEDGLHRAVRRWIT